MSRELRTVSRSLRSIGTALERLGPLVDALRTGQAGGRGGQQRARAPMSPARRAALKQQGQYMGYLRNLKPRQKSQVKALRESKGIVAAIALARKLGQR